MNSSHILNNIFSVLTDYLLGQANTTLEYDCIRQLSKSLPVTLLDFDGNTVIPPYNMRTGTDQKFIEHGYIEKSPWNMNHVIYHIL